MSLDLLLIATPVVLSLAVRLLRRPKDTPADLARGLRDLITLRMVLQDTDANQRAALLKAHRAWRVARQGRPSSEERR